MENPARGTWMSRLRVPVRERSSEGTRRAPQRGAFSAHSLSRDKEWDAAKGLAAESCRDAVLVKFPDILEIQPRDHAEVIRPRGRLTLTGGELPGIVGLIQDVINTPEGRGRRPGPAAQPQSRRPAPGILPAAALDHADRLFPRLGIQIAQ